MRSEAGASERVTSNVSRTTCRRLATEHVLPQHILGLAPEAIDCHCSAIQVSLIGFAPVFQRTSTHRQCAKTNHAGTRGSCRFATQSFQAAPPNWTDFRFLPSFCIPHLFVFFVGDHHRNVIRGDAEALSYGRQRLIKSPLLHQSSRQILQLSVPFSMVINGNILR